MKLFKFKMRELQLRKITIVLSFTILMFSLTGCLDTDDENLPEPVPVAYVSIYHGDPSAPVLDIVVDDEPLNRDPFEYTEHTDGYLPFYTGERNIKFNSYNGSKTLADTTVNLKENMVYSIFITSDTSEVETLIIEDNITQPAAGKAMVRLVNLSPDAPAVDLTLEGEGSPLFEELGYKSASDFKEIAAGTTSFELAETGEEGEVLLSPSDINLQEGRIYTLVLRGYNTPPSGNNNGLDIQTIQNYFTN